MLEVKNLRKVFRVGGGEVEALGSVTQEVAEGEFFVLLGPSGSGKTTLLRCVAGLEMPDAGEIRDLRPRRAAVGIRGGGAGGHRRIRLDDVDLAG